jgi:glutamate N-acetyltransferase / amino-acid N-acetyltransferase
MQSLCKINGVYASAIAAGIKAKGLDLSYIYAPNAVASAGVFTTNQFKAACVKRNQSLFGDQVIKAIIVNSGNANAVTGEQGDQNNKKIAEYAAGKLGLSSFEVATASTGIIGRHLPMEKYLCGLDQLLHHPSRQEDELSVRAIMTTDTVEKAAYFETEVNGQVIKCAGIAKGSGMIAPNMATMLGFIVTNFPCTNQELQVCLTEACNYSFNLISVDGDTSTNDMVLAMAVPEAGIQNRPDSFIEFKKLLTQTCQSLSQQIIRDGEGATRLITIEISEASSYEAAKQIAMTVANSPLVKTAIHGADPNWGRILAAIGRSGVSIDPNLVNLSLQGCEVVRQGQPLAFDRNHLHQLLQSADVIVHITLGQGDHSIKAWGCDLSRGYVDINVEYN